jgi:hypothetical protein
MSRVGQVVHLPSLSDAGAAVEAQPMRGGVGERVQWCRQVDDVPYRLRPIAFKVGLGMKR